MHRLISGAGIPAIVLGAMMLLELAAMRIALTADDDFVYVLGNRINLVCSVKQRLGIPCPTCGLTRGFVLTLHAKVSEAWRLSPTGPLAALGMLCAGGVLLAFGAMQWRGMQVQIAWMKRCVQGGAFVYAAGGTVVWITAWLSAVARARAHP